MKKKGIKPWQGYKNEVYKKLGKPKYRKQKAGRLNGLSVDRLAVLSANYFIQEK